MLMRNADDVLAVQLVLGPLCTRKWIDLCVVNWAISMFISLTKFFWLRYVFLKCWFTDLSVILWRITVCRGKYLLLAFQSLGSIKIEAHKAPLAFIGVSIFVVIAETLERERSMKQCKPIWQHAFSAHLAVHNILSEFGKIRLLFSFVERLWEMRQWICLIQQPGKIGHGLTNNESCMASFQGVPG